MVVRPRATSVIYSTCRLPGTRGDPVTAGTISSVWDALLMDSLFFYSLSTANSVPFEV